MQIYLKEEMFKSNIQDLARRGYNDFIFVQIGNKRGFVVSKNINLIATLSQKNSFIAILKVAEKVPLYKQDMQLRMGRVPKATNDVLRTYTVRVLEKCRDFYSYSVWSII